jgi:signal peptidase I
METRLNTDRHETEAAAEPLLAVPVPPPLPARKRSLAREYLESLVVTVILALFGTTFLMQAFKIPSSSMEDTLLVGDHLMVNKLAYAPRAAWAALPYRQISRGDVVVFKYPIAPQTHFVKRVVAVPGDRLRIAQRSVMVNGRLLAESYKVHKSGTLEEFRDQFPSLPVGPVFPQWSRELSGHVQDGWLVVPEGKYFVLGDNRDFSSDSRYWGFVPRENILGKPLVIYWSVTSTSREYLTADLRERWRGILAVIIDFPRKTRWERMFRIVHGAQE